MISSGSKPGKLVLIGCGPGAADLLTVRAANRIASADLILYDRLVPDEITALSAPSADKRYVGKEPGDGGVQQGALNVLIVDALIAGKTVARLKSGDPMIFGRAAEEIAAAASVGANVEIVPGVTAALAAASDAIINVTERSELQTFVVTTGRTARSECAPDWSQIVRPGVCIAVYMGVGQAWRIQAQLLAAGVPGNAPADWVERAGRTDSRSVSTRVDRVSLTAKTEHISNPAMLLVRYPHSLAALNQPQTVKRTTPV